MNKKNKKIRVGLIGLGEQMLDNLLPSILLTNKCEIISLCDISELVLKEIGEKLHVENLYSDYTKMITSESFDVIFVASSPEVHYNVIKLCIENKIAVFVEKPPVRNVSELTNILELNNQNILIGVGMNFSYSDSHNSIMELINDKDFGKLSSVTIEHLSSKPIEPFWNFDSIIESFLLAQLIHPLDYLLRMGGKFSKINVFCSKNIQPFFLSVVIEFENGIVGHIKSGSFYPRFRHQIEITSENGNIINVDDLSKVEVTTKNIDLPFNINANKCNIISHKSPLKSGYSSAGYSNEITNFLKSYLENIPFETNLESMINTYYALTEIHEKILKITTPLEQCILSN
ncbi:Gfo/Idh/MocA family oxidoreductase [Flavobacterium sp. P4023]|uniref:Gfo/Idh/MocA family oxidoreductase n=1 Tax=Flavobacterium flabelliforme TaxID=2816119 RepID=A0ABS5CTW3_9FLAO|nr:Gfo/Idh/MocA family oxidoreductase [Flavobacterium flabelliforme]MBP4142047.1 Gfo/Idh/MocA family oxidoreductase [Flavobacterium flabelliforme]